MKCFVCRRKGDDSWWPLFSSLINIKGGGNSVLLLLDSMRDKERGMKLAISLHSITLWRNTFSAAVVDRKVEMKEASVCVCVFVCEIGTIKPTLSTPPLFFNTTT